MDKYALSPLEKSVLETMLREDEFNPEKNSFWDKELPAIEGWWTPKRQVDNCSKLSQTKTSAIRIILLEKNLIDVREVSRKDRHGRTFTIKGVRLTLDPEKIPHLITTLAENELLYYLRKGTRYFGLVKTPVRIWIHEYEQEKKRQQTNRPALKENLPKTMLNDIRITMLELLTGKKIDRSDKKEFNQALKNFLEFEEAVKRQEITAQVIKFAFQE